MTERRVSARWAAVHEAGGCLGCAQRIERVLVVTLGTTQTRLCAACFAVVRRLAREG